MNNILLTLGLPIYNGERCIGLTLHSIKDALEKVKYKNSIEILISNNSSTDYTTTVIKKFIEKGLRISFCCNKKNVGYDQNIDSIVEKANGKYVWFLGCGESVKKASLSRLIEKLNTDIEYTNVLLDFDIYDEKKERITDKRIYDFNEDIILEGKNNFLYDKYCPALSSNIINKIKWLQIQKDELVVNGWCHIERILSMIALDNNSKTLLLPYPYFTLYREEDGWWTKPDSYLLLLLHVKVIESMLDKGFSKKNVKKLKNKQSQMALIGAILQSKKYGLKISVKLVNEMVTIFKQNIFFWIFVFPILLLPNKLLFFPKIFFKKIKKMLKYVKAIIC